MLLQEMQASDEIGMNEKCSNLNDQDTICWMW